MKRMSILKPMSILKRMAIGQICLWAAAMFFLTACGAIQIKFDDKEDPEVARRFLELNSNGVSFSSIPIETKTHGFFQKTIRIAGQQSSSIGPVSTGTSGEGESESEKTKRIKYTWGDTTGDSATAVSCLETSRWEKSGFGGINHRTEYAFRVVIGSEDPVIFHQRASTVAVFAGDTLRIPYVNQNLESVWRRGIAVVRRDSLIAWTELAPTPTLWLRAGQDQKAITFLTALSSALTFQDEDKF